MEPRQKLKYRNISTGAIAFFYATGDSTQLKGCEDGIIYSKHTLRKSGWKGSKENIKGKRNPMFKRKTAL